jgi:hypothetical protein
VSNELENLEDLRALAASGYSLSVIGAHLVVNDVFYIGVGGDLQKGRLAAPLNQPTPSTLGPPVNHQMFWAGADPHHVDGTPIPSLGNIQSALDLGGTLFARHLSNKPPEGFPTYVDLVEHYVALISAPAEAAFGVTPRTGAIYDVPEDASPFKVRDTFSARAEITDLNTRLAEDRIAIIGLGGTGSFVLDFMVKTPVHSIDAFDFDTFEVHNGFRCPGEVPFDLFGHPKTEVARHKYQDFRHRLRVHKKRVEAGDEPLFDGITFAFVCIDDGEARAQIIDMLTALEIPFVDVGMGVEKEAGKLDGLLRTTLFTSETAERARAGVPLDARHAEGAYRVFVQIAELNALNAAAAVIRYKQLRSFYADQDNYYQTHLTIGSSNWVGDA